MAKISIPCLVPKTNKAGITSWFWQPSATLKAAGWKSKPLGKDMRAAIAEAERINLSVEQWKLGGERPAEITRRAVIGTLSSLIDRYRKERVLGINQLTGKPWVKASTAAGYETGLKRLDMWAGKQPLAYFTPARVTVLRNASLHPDTGIGHAATLNLLRTGRQLFAFAESVDIIPKGSNPFTDFDLGAVPARNGVWEDEDEAAFIAAAYAMGLPSMALAAKLAIYTAQREADLLAMNEAQIRPMPILNPLIAQRLAAPDGTVWGWQFGQGKSNGTTLMQIPLEPELLAEVQDALRTNRARDRLAKPQRLLSYVLVDDRTNMPWHLDAKGQQRKGDGHKRAFIKQWTRVAERAAKDAKRPHITKLVWHDFRRTRVVRLRRMGMAPDMIASITGHSPRSIEMMLKVYGPIDPTITAAAIVSAMPALPVEEENHSNNNAKTA